ncbi:MAG: adenylosuccinate synthase [Spirochaetia bacterium]|jgi:adenylosuccinate synthase|nr:adenylosuccinate synthase [Spirochaetia bacterium]
MSCTVIIGSQWGDEGKAKMVDYFSRDADVVVRYQGGANAGHTVVVNGKKYIFHLVPSGILHENKMCVIGNGLALDPLQLLEELDKLELEGLDVKKRLLISDSVHLILPYHKVLDEAMEELRDNKLGTTHRGIGPCYADKCLRIGVRAGDIFDADSLKERVEFLLKLKNLQLERVFGKKPFAMKEIMDIISLFKERAGKMITNTSDYLHASVKSGKKLLLEGAQGYGLDIDHGTYPFVTSSNPTIGGALLGSGLNSFNVSSVVGIVKAYVTRVGEGPFPTEDTGNDGDRLRVNGKEFGSTTGRPRRCGWFDIELLKHSCLINGFTTLALTKLDVLTGFKKIKVAVRYEHNGKDAGYSQSSLDSVEPVYEELNGWDENLSKVKTYDTLPSQAKDYIRFLEKNIGAKISTVSVGPERENTFLL